MLNIGFDVSLINSLVLLMVTFLFYVDKSVNLQMDQLMVKAISTAHGNPKQWRR